MTSDEFKAIRKRLGLSQEALAEHFGMCRTGIQCIERKSPVPKVYAMAIERLCETLGKRNVLPEISSLTDWLKLSDSLERSAKDIRRLRASLEAL